MENEQLNQDEQELTQQFERSEESAAEQPDEDFIDLGQAKLPRKHAEVLGEFYAWLQRNPEAAVAIDSFVAGRARLVPLEEEQPPQEPPSDEKPSEEQKEPEPTDELELLRRKVSALEEAYRREQLATAQAAVAEGQARFAKKMGLTDEEIAKVSQVAAAIGSLPRFVEQAGDMISGVELALENAYWTIPEMRERAINQMLQSPDLARRQKATSLSGSGGSAPRQTAPTSPSERREAMIREITEALRGPS